MISYHVSIQSQIGVPDIGLTLNSETISTNIRDYGNVTRTVADRVRLKPRMHHLFNNGKDNMVRVPFTLQHALNGTVNGVDHDLVTGVAVEWLQIDQFRSDDDIKNDSNTDQNALRINVFPLPEKHFPYAIGQGALAIMCRQRDVEQQSTLYQTLRSLNDFHCEMCCKMERTLLRILEGHLNNS